LVSLSFHEEKKQTILKSQHIWNTINATKEFSFLEAVQADPKGRAQQIAAIKTKAQMKESVKKVLYLHLCTIPAICSSLYFPMLLQCTGGNVSTSLRRKNQGIEGWHRLQKRELLARGSKHASPATACSEACTK
jgi:hypothetical protein